MDVVVALESGTDTLGHSFNIIYSVPFVPTLPMRPQTRQSGPYKKVTMGFPGGAVVKNLPANAGDMGSSPGPGRSHMP